MGRVLWWICWLACVACAHPTVRPLQAPRATLDTTPAWQPWSADAFAQARSQRKLILLSVQAEFCHWCHVMNATTYRDPRVVALLRERFVTLRVDEAERPDLSARYADWGWPATALLTPEARGIVTLRGHRPAQDFLHLLRELVAELDAGGALAPRESPRPGAGDSDLARGHARALAQLDALYDSAQGGWGRPQKYPFAAPVEHAFLRAFVAGEAARRERALATLRGHAQLIDPVAGGMFQYSLRGVWSAPHYEKLASIQAGALANFAEAYRASGEARWLDDAHHIARYVLTSLRAANGAFFASQNADAGALGEPDYLEGARFYALDAGARARVAEPARDEHVYANLNGQLIQGLLALHRASPDPGLLATAREACAALTASHARGPAFAHEAGDDGALVYLSDQVEMATALLALADASAERDYRARAYATMDFVIARLSDRTHGGFFAQSEDASAVGVFAERQKPAADNARFARLLLTRARREDDPALRALAEQTLAAQLGDEQLARQGRKVSDLLLGLEHATSGYVTFSIVGFEDDPRTRALYDVAYRAYVPHGILRLEAPGESHYPYPDRPAVYLCSDSACSAPASTPEELSSALAAFVRETRAR
jgi:uncharacterized protein YyaL (SSP411 family)